MNTFHIVFKNEVPVYCSADAMKSHRRQMMLQAQADERHRRYQQESASPVPIPRRPIFTITPVEGE